MTQRLSPQKPYSLYAVFGLVLPTLLILAGVSAAVLTCDYCGRQITDQYVQYESGAYHVHCYENHLALRCSICGGIIDGQYLIDSRDNIFHHFHEDELWRCDYCGCLICDQLTEGGLRYGDGREVCGLCVQTAVNDADEAQRLMLEAMDGLRKFGIDIDDEDIPLELVDVPKMRRINNGSADDPLGYTTFKTESYLSGLISTTESKIYLLHGLPRARFIFGVAHELMHVWLFENGPSDMAPMLCEGSCDYAATLMIRKSGEPESDQVFREAMDNPDPVYGEGLRRVDAYVSRVGVSAWLDYLKSHTKAPW